MNPITPGTILTSGCAGVAAGLGFLVLMLAVIDRAKAAITGKDGIEAFVTSFDGEQFESKTDRQRRG